MSDDKKSFYVTAPIFYPNANLHMGHAYSTVLADCIARYKRLSLDKKDVYFLVGADENTEKVVRAAVSAAINTNEYLDTIVSNFKTLFSELEISYDQFIRTTDSVVHWPGAIEVWNRLVKAHDLEKRPYEGLYCVGHESFITEKELVNGLCPDHNEAPQRLQEENWFFKLSKYTSRIKEKIESNELLIFPETRRNEILAQLERGLEDVSFSRPIEKMSVGIPVPNDPTQKMYVWCDALTSYISALGFGSRDDSPFKKFWPADVHVIGKDILRFHAAIWPGMLLSAGIALPKKIFVHGFIRSGGKKMSKTLGNVIDPRALVKEYGAEAVRYYLMRHISPFEDGELNLEGFKEAYNANLANGLGNLANRIMKMAESNLSVPVEIPPNTIPQNFLDAMDSFDIKKATDIVWSLAASLDERIQTTAPFKLVKTDRPKAEEIIQRLVIDLYTVARMLNPVMPLTSDKIKKAVKENKMPNISLFPRKE